jgi:tetrahydromethanopterin S-methyltransferase subunit D
MTRFVAGLIGGLLGGIAAMFLAAFYLGQADDDSWMEAVQVEQACQDLAVDKAKEIDCRDLRRR